MTADTTDLRARVAELAAEMNDYSNTCRAAAEKWRFARRAHDRLERRKWVDRMATFALVAATLRAVLAEREGA